MITEIQFVPRLHAEALPGDADTVVVSIQTPGQEPAALQEGYRDILRLWFDDLYEELWENLALRPVVPDIGENNQPVDVMGYVWFDLHMARCIQEFVQIHHRAAEPVRLLVHCEAGVSRSAAVAKWAGLETGAPLVGTNTDTELANQRVLRLLAAAKE